jgi:hypothetical protein
MQIKDAVSFVSKKKDAVSSKYDFVDERKQLRCTTTDLETNSEQDRRKLPIGRNGIHINYYFREDSPFNYRKFTMLHAPHDKKKRCKLRGARKRDWEATVPIFWRSFSAPVNSPTRWRE